MDIYFIAGVIAGVVAGTVALLIVGVIIAVIIIRRRLVLHFGHLNS